MVATDIKSIAKEANGFISIASEAVKVAPEYQNIIGNLLGNTIIVDHLKHAMNWHVRLNIELVLLLWKVIL